MMTRVGLALSVLSLILLSASAFRDEDAPYNVMATISQYCKRIINRVLDGEAFDILTNYHRWTISIAIGVLFVSAWFMIGSILIWTGSTVPNIVSTWEHADLSNIYGVFVYLFGLIVIAFFGTVGLFPLGVVLLIVFGMAVTWAKDGGTKGKFVARVGLLIGVFSIAIQMVAGG